MKAIENGPLMAPPTAKSADDPSRRDTSAFSPLRDAECFTANHKTPVVSSVSILLGICRPSAIAWFVALVIVDPINAGTRWPNTHIDAEVVEVEPPRADGNSAPTISSVSRVVVIQASSEYAGPDHVLSRPFAESGRSVSGERVGSLATTTARIARLEMAGTGFYDYTAETLTDPDDGRSGSLISCRDCRQAPEALAGKVNHSGGVRMAFAYPRSCVPNQTSAASGISSAEAVANDFKVGPAFALAPPRDGSSRSGANAADLRDDGQASELLADQIQQFWHPVILAETALTLFPRQSIEDALC